MQKKNVIRPGYQTRIVRADDRRAEFDCKNQVIVQNEIPVDVVFAGDSIIQMWELEAYFHECNLRMINRGIGGDRTYYFRRRFQADVIQLQPAVCVVMIGINDTWDLEGDNIKGLRGKKAGDILKIAEINMEKVVREGTRAGIDMILCSVLPSDFQYTEHKEERDWFVKEYNRRVENLCIRYHQFYLDFYHDFLDGENTGLNKQLSMDGIHPNVFGYDIMSNKVKQILLKREEKTT